MSETATIRPKSIDEIQHAFKDWWSQDLGRPFGPNIQFSRPSRSANLLLMRVRLKNDMRVQFKKDRLVCEVAGKALNLLLEDPDADIEDLVR